MTIRAWLGVLGLGIAVAGCQAVPGDGPFMNGAKQGSTEAFPFDVIDLTPTTVVAYRPTGAVEPASTAGESTAGSAITVAPGDVLRVRIFERYAGGTFPTINSGDADLGSQIVTPGGTIEVPYAGTVKVAGLGLRQIERTIEGRLAGKAKEPQVIVELVSDRTNTVMVSGDVRKPGRISLTEGLRTVVDAINRAGGVAASTPTASSTGAGGAASGSAGAGTAAAIAAGAGGSGLSQAPPVSQASQFEVVLRRGGQVILDRQLSELLAGGDTAIEKGDEIVVRPNSRVITVLGAVAVAGNIPMNKPNMTLTDALSEVHGLFDLRSNKTGLYVFRLGDIQDNPQARARIFRLDFMQPVSVFVAQQFAMQPKDVIFVANAPLYEYDKVLTAIYRTAVVGGIATGRFAPTVGF
ncbi:MAG: polysaccharide biosynthesis/export family protein [Proteobacteria bacterium]|nr:polysaccharide biosynthesis/export family protein [Pseudomonadota bacterium]